MTFGFRSMAGPFEQLGPEAFSAPGWIFCRGLRRRRCCWSRALARPTMGSQDGARHVALGACARCGVRPAPRPFRSANPRRSRSGGSPTPGLTCSSTSDSRPRIILRRFAEAGCRVRAESLPLKLRPRRIRRPHDGSDRRERPRAGSRERSRKDTERRIRHEGCVTVDGRAGPYRRRCETALVTELETVVTKRVRRRSREESGARTTDSRSKRVRLIFRSGDPLGLPQNFGGYRNDPRWEILDQ
jgi:hypothetical protein